MNVTTYSKIDFLALEKPNTANEYYISILPTGGPYCEPIFLEDTNNIITMVFDETDNNSIIKYDPDIGDYHFVRCFTREQAIKMHEFLDKISNDSNVHIHCVFGYSRSTAIAKYLVDYKGASSPSVLTGHNHTVYELLVNTMKD